MSDLALWVRLLDSLVGLLMWLLLLQAFLTLILPDNNRFAPFLMLNRITKPALKISGYITPHFIITRLHALIACFWIFIIRIYVFPTAFHYDIEKFSDMPLEQLLSRIFAALLG